jgi:hydrogenase maturation protease
MAVAKLLILGYGNPNREDDGVGWHVLQQLATHFNTDIAGMLAPVDEIDQSPPPHLVFSLQLMPEMAEPLAAYDHVCFVDAHTGAYNEGVRVASIGPGYSGSAFTHHITPETCLALAQTLYGRVPQGLLVSVRGYHFGYSTELSAQTAPLAAEAAQQIIAWAEEKLAQK